MFSAKIDQVSFPHASNMISSDSIATRVSFLYCHMMFTKFETYLMFKLSFLLSCPMKYFVVVMLQITFYCYDPFTYICDGWIYCHWGKYLISSMLENYCQHCGLNQSVPYHTKVKRGMLGSVTSLGLPKSVYKFGDSSSNASPVMGWTSQIF